MFAQFAESDNNNTIILSVCCPHVVRVYSIQATAEMNMSVVIINRYIRRLDRSNSEFVHCLSEVFENQLCVNIPAEADRDFGFNNRRSRINCVSIYKQKLRLLVYNTRRSLINDVSTVSEISS